MSFVFPVALQSRAIRFVVSPQGRMFFIYSDLQFLKVLSQEATEGYHWRRQLSKVEKAHSFIILQIYEVLVMLLWLTSRISNLLILFELVFGY